MSTPIHPENARGVAHPRVTERTEFGPSGSARNAPVPPGRVRTGVRSDRIRSPSLRARRQAAPQGTGADSLWTDAHLAVRVLSWRCPGHGKRSRDDARFGLARTAVRGCAPVELRDLRLARAASCSSTSTILTTAARTLGMGRQAAWRRVSRWRGARTGLQRSGSRDGRSRHAARSYRDAMRPVRGAEATLKSSMPALRSKWGTVARVPGRDPRASF